jgi:undecaprenyl diphosphate synthase
MSDLPVHIGIIPDGNRRWAKAHGLPTLEGHRRGLAVAHDVAIYVFEQGVKNLTVYAFSNENWNRAEEEVGYLMNLFHRFVTTQTKTLHEKGVRVVFLGRREGLPEKLVAAMEKSEADTAKNTAGTLSVCLNYGGKTELVDAVKSLIRSGVRAEDVTAEMISSHLYAPDVPPVDMIIRTSGEQRTSGFMLWRSDYAEFYWSAKLWPEFTQDDVDTALAEFKRRQRRYGA